MHTAIYAGSFDPPTKGHVDLIVRASGLFERLVVAIGIHPTRKPLFSTEERLALLRSIVENPISRPEGPPRTLKNIEVQTFKGLLIDHCHAIGAQVIVRGLRAATDFELELQNAHANADLGPDVDTIFLPTRTNYGFVSASLVREIASHHGDVSRFAEPVVCEALRKKFANPPVTG
jgi:pantetheine-phosphate adenylyltransferase